jgi:hypothetical protein
VSTSTSGQAAGAPLNAEQLIAEAKRSTSLSDLGPDQSFLVGLNKFIHAVEAMNPPQVLRDTAHRQIVHILETRLRMREDDKQHPDITAQKIEKPLIVIGLPRTGTTITYDLLTLDPTSRAPREWEWYMPWPPTDAATFTTDPRIAAVTAMYDVWLKHAPDLLTIQRFDCTQPGECNHGMLHHFASTNFWAEYGVPEYSKWIQEDIQEGLYGTHKRLLQGMQWKGPKGHWFLKSPNHLLDLDALIETYPDACLVWTHRDPVYTFSSLASMVSKFQRATGGGQDLKAVGRSVMEMWSAAMARGTRSRNNNPKVEKAILDLAHRDVVHDPIGTIRKIYDRFGFAFTPEHEARIRKFLVESSAAKRLGQHKHSPEEFGIDRDEVHRRLADYYARFGHLLAKA